MTEQEAYKKILPLLESPTEGLFWDFKSTLTDTADIIKDILAFSNSAYDGDSYIIVGVREPTTMRRGNKIALTDTDRRRLNTDAKYIYPSVNWEICGLSAKDIDSMKQFSARLSGIISTSMLISHPQCEFIPIRIQRSRWLYLIVVKKVPGVFLSKKDIPHDYDVQNIAIKQGVLYVRIADTTIGAAPEVASASEHIRVWKRYINWLHDNDDAAILAEGDGNE